MKARLPKPLKIHFNDNSEAFGVLIPTINAIPTQEIILLWVLKFMDRMIQLGGPTRRVRDARETNLHYVAFTI